MNTVTDLDFADIQALVVRGYGNLPAAMYLLLKIDQPTQARSWLRKLIQETTFAQHKPDTVALNIALTYHGLTALDVPADILERFSNEFRSGMNTAHKRRTLGDEGDNAPEFWDWGGPNTAPVDVLLLCYAVNPDILETTCARLRKDFPAHGLSEIARLDTQESIEFKEHFGFRDSISQPYFAEFDSKGPIKPNPVALGEVLLGYPNSYGRYTQSPQIEPDLDPQDLLATDPEGSGLRDIGKNGTYLVFRQLAQDVKTFWSFMRAHGALCEHNPHTVASDAQAIHLGARMVGRWPSGTPLVLAPEQDEPTIEDKDHFAYHDADPDGFKCPIGAHIRRTHPRDSLEPDPGTQKSIDFSNRHRLLRRGRTYGTPFHPTMEPKAMLAHLDEGDAQAERGLHFICLNANIGRQFEFVQHTWAGNPTFNGLYHDPDPLIGPREAFGSPQDQFSIQAEPVRCQVQGLPSFVRVRGGDYFFLPSRRALNFLLSPGVAP